jgi:hypothetical protein
MSARTSRPDRPSPGAQPPMPPCRSRRRTPARPG